MARYTKYTSNYIKRSKHQTLKGGSLVFERDWVTTGGKLRFGEGKVPFYGDGNFVFTTSYVPNFRKKHQLGIEVGEWNYDDVKNANNDINYVKVDEKSDDIRSFAYYGSAVELVRTSIENIIKFFPANAWTESILSTAGYGNSGYAIVQNPFGINFKDPFKSDFDVNPMRFMYTSAIDNYNINNTEITGYTVIARELYRNNITGELQYYAENEVPDNNWARFSCQMTEWLPELDQAGTIQHNAIYTIELTLKNEINVKQGVYESHDNIWTEVDYLTSTILIDAYISDNEVILLSRYSHWYLEPKKDVMRDYFDNLSGFEKVLLDEKSTPVYTSNFITPIVTENNVYYYRRKYTWPSIESFESKDQIKPIELEWSNFGIVNVEDVLNAETGSLVTVSNQDVYPVNHLTQPIFLESGDEISLSSSGVPGYWIMIRTTPTFNTAFLADRGAYSTTDHRIIINRNGYYAFCPEVSNIVVKKILNGKNIYSFIDINSPNYIEYVGKLTDMAQNYDNSWTNNLYNRMTHEAIKNYDWTYGRYYNDGDEEDNVIGGEKMQKILLYVGRVFDDVKKYIDKIKDLNKNTYLGYNNSPNALISDNLELKGWDVFSTIPVFDGESMNETVINRYNPTNWYNTENPLKYSASDNDIEFMRRLLLNTRRIMQTKGTEHSIDMVMGMFGYGADDYEVNYEYRKVRPIDYEDEDIIEGELFGDAIVDINSNKMLDFVYADDDVSGIPVGSFAENKVDEENKIVAKTWVVPMFNNNKIYDGDIAFQSKGGWAAQIKNGQETINTDNWTETLSYLHVVSTISDLTSVNPRSVTRGDIYYVCNLLDYAEVKQQEIPDDLTNFFVLDDDKNSEYVDNPENYDENAFIDSNDLSSWRYVSFEKDDHGEYIDKYAEKALYLDSLISNNSGNNPHVGYGTYDKGEEFWEYMKKPFKYSIDNLLFSEEYMQKAEDVVFDISEPLVYQLKEDRTPTPFMPKSLTEEEYNEADGYILIDPTIESRTIPLFVSKDYYDTILDANKKNYYIQAKSYYDEVQKILNTTNGNEEYGDENYYKNAIDEDIYFIISEKIYNGDFESGEGYVNGFSNNPLSPYEPAQKNAQGYYEINNGGKLFWLAQKVNSESGSEVYDAKLTANIDLENRNWVPMGNNSHRHKGEFDGQGYKISNLKIETNAQFCAFIGYHDNGNKPIKSFVIEGSVIFTGNDTNENFISGVVGVVGPHVSNVQNIYCSVNIDTPNVAYNSLLRIGGIVANGYCDGGIIEKCVYDGTIKSYNSGYQASGILGFMGTQGKNIIVRNCLFVGKIESTNRSVYAAGIVGYVGISNPNCYFENCLSIGEYSNTQPNPNHTGALIGSGRNNVAMTFDNCYILQGQSAKGTDSAFGTTIPYIEATAQDLTNGTVTNGLGNNVWVQGENYPIPTIINNYTQIEIPKNYYLNSKAVTIKNKLPKNEYHRLYFKNIILNYLLQVIPSSTILILENFETNAD